MAFSNSVTLAEKYVPLMDAVFKKASLTAPLEAGSNRIRFDGGNKVSIFKVSTDGLGNYSRNNGYVDGSVTGNWESFTLSKDRGRRFLIDTMDNDETLDQLLGGTVSEFIRTRVVPEVDAYRFATLAGASGIGTAAADITAGTTDVTALLDTAEEYMGDNEVPQEGRLLYVSELTYKALKQKGITRTLANENGVSRVIEMYDGMEVRRVPKARFCTGITLYDGSTVGQTGGGYKFTASSSKPINFMVIHPESVIAAMKHEAPKLISPEANQTHDGWFYMYRLYHDIFVEANKLAGIYAHIGSTALAADITG